VRNSKHAVSKSSWKSRMRASRDALKETVCPSPDGGGAGHVVSQGHDEPRSQKLLPLQACSGNSLVLVFILVSEY
jgi:hypothetical protein